MMDPLVGAVCNPKEIWQMVDEMLVAGEQWLPQYSAAIAEAKERLASGESDPDECRQRRRRPSEGEDSGRDDAGPRGREQNAGESDKGKDREKVQ